MTGAQAQVFPTLTEFSSAQNANILCYPKYGFFPPSVQEDNPHTESRFLILFQVCAQNRF